MTAIRQISENRLRSSLRPAAVLRLPLDEFAETSGISFETHRGNLGEQRDALLEADDGRQYMLVEHCEGPTHDVELRLDERTPHPNLAVDHFLKTFELSPDAVVWRVDQEDWEARHGSIDPVEATGLELQPTSNGESDLPQELAAYQVLASRYASTTQAQWQVPLLAMTAEAALLAGILATKATSIAAILSAVSVVIACIAPLATRRIELTAWWDREMLDAYEANLLPPDLRLH